MKDNVEHEITSGIDNLEQASLLTADYEDMEEIEMLLNAAQANIMLAISTFHSVKYLLNDDNDA